MSNAIISKNLGGTISVEKEVKCAWCGELVSPAVKTVRNENGEIKERRCPKCNSMVGAYLDEKRTVLAKVRTFDS